jgi:hypothetical protein
MLKFLPSGKLFARYSNLKLGSINFVDATNPLKILVYYKDFQQIIFLDNQLSVNSEVVGLEKLGYEQTELVCAGSNNSFWLYSKQNNDLVRFNEQSKKIVSTGNLKQVLQTELNPVFMLEHNNYLYLSSPETGIYVFDIFGAFSKIISVKQIRNFQVNDNLLYFQRDSCLCSYDHQKFEEVCRTYSTPASAKGLRVVMKKIAKAYRDSIVLE